MGMSIGEHIEEWLRSMYSREIEEQTSAIANERLWANGASGDEVGMHLENAERIERYVEVLTRLRDNVGKEACDVHG